MEITSQRYNYREAVKPPRKSKLGLLLAVFVFFILAPGAYTVVALNGAVPLPTASALSLEPVPAETTVLSWPSVGQAAIGTVDNGLLATSSEAQAAAPIASMTKVVTALAVLEKAPITPDGQGETYTYTSEDKQLFDMYLTKDGSVIPIKVGGTITQYQALQALMLVSANNIADMLAIKHFGSVEAYAQYAQTMVAEWGLKDTTISDASGFSLLTKSTPSDMIVIAQKALAHPLLSSIFQQKEATLPEAGVVKNSNQFLNEPNALGIKTGTTDEAGYCLLFAATHAVDDVHTEKIVGVVMGQKTATGLQQSVKQLLASSYVNFEKRTVVDKGAVVGRLETAWGQQSPLIASIELSTYRWKGKAISPTIAIDQPTTTAIGGGQKLGTVTLAGTDLSSSVVTGQAIGAPGIWWRLVNYP